MFGELAVSDFEGRLRVGFKYNTSHTFLFNLYGRQVWVLCFQLGFSWRKIITVAPYLVSMLSCCRMFIAACNLGLSLLQALDPVACAVLFKMSVALCSNLVLFATPWRRMDEWMCSYTLLDPDIGCRWVFSFSHLPLHSALLPHKEPEGTYRFPLDRGQRQPRIRSGCSGEEKNFRYCEELSPVPQARCHVQCMPSQHCVTCPRVAGLFLFLGRCLSFIRSSFLASLLVLFSIFSLIWTLLLAVTLECTASNGWIIHGTWTGNISSPETSVTN